MKLLMLGGTAEARDLAARLDRSAGLDLTVSLAGATRDPLLGPGTTRIGGFGGDEGFARYLRDARPDVIVDATHPFADRITRRTARMAAQAGIPYRLLLRPPWTPQSWDVWHEVANEAEAAARVHPDDHVFLATGRQTLAAFSGMRAAYTWCRQIDPPDGPYPYRKGEFLVGRPPFSVDDEVALFRRLGITVLIVKHAGGAASRTKLDAARTLGIPVLMIRRPDYTGIEQVSSVEEMMTWVGGLNNADHPL
ncbi:cobalt-precorrin-6A reductase [Tropicimonas sp. S265A]|uniref:cobalt-precorrin-6A reductase n=1 Tax=Tropicimonas sp. S265A TaxID=3415134 RepID=UPI003C7C7B1D